MFFRFLASGVLGLSLLLGSVAHATVEEQALRKLTETYFLHETRNFVQGMGFKDWTPAELSRSEDEGCVVASYVMKPSTIGVVTFNDKTSLPTEIVYIVAPSGVSKDGPLMTTTWQRDIEEVLAVAGAQLFQGATEVGSPLHQSMLRTLGPENPALKINQGVVMDFPKQELRLEGRLLENPLAYVLKINKIVP